MSVTKHEDKSEQITLNAKEKSAIKYGQSLLQTPKNGQSDPLTKIERKAIDYAKSLLGKLKPQ